MQQARAAKRGRGRRAPAPLQHSLAWLEGFFVRTYTKSRTTVCWRWPPAWPSIPCWRCFRHRRRRFLLCAVRRRRTISKHLSIASDIVPAGALDLLGDEIARIAAKSDGKLTFGFLLGLGIALWSANAGMKAIFDALNIIYDEDEKRGIIWLNVVSLFFTVCAIAARWPGDQHWWSCFRCCWPPSGSPASIIRSSAICAGRECSC